MKHIAILQFPGTNCEYDTQYAFEKLGAKTSILWHESTQIPHDIDLVVIPGGFSYGDYLRSGALAKFAPIMKSIEKYTSQGGKVLGICNGFQILVECGLLPGALKRNNNLHFISKFHHLKVVNNDNTFLQKFQKGDLLNIPVAHHDGNYFIQEDELESLVQNNQILLQYCDENGNNSVLNGSTQQIAGVCNKEKNIFGLMPHPERAIEKLIGGDDGVKMLEGFLQ